MSKETTFISLLGGIADIYALEKPETVKSAIVYKLISSVPRKMTNGTEYFRERFQFDCYGESLSESVGYANNLISLMDDNVTDFYLSYVVNKSYLAKMEDGLFVSYVDCMIW